MEMKLDSFAVSICCCEYGFIANSPVLLEFAFHQNVVECKKLENCRSAQNQKFSQPPKADKYLTLAEIAQLVERRTRNA